MELCASDFICRHLCRNAESHGLIFQSLPFFFSSWRPPYCWQSEACLAVTEGDFCPSHYRQTEKLCLLPNTDVRHSSSLVPLWKTSQGLALSLCGVELISLLCFVQIHSSDKTSDFIWWGHLHELILYIILYMFMYIQYIFIPVWVGSICCRWLLWALPQMALCFRNLQVMARAEKYWN